MKAISIKQPWAIAIFRGKDVENRTKPSKYRGPLLIHAALKSDKAANEIFKRDFPGIIRVVDFWVLGCIIGKVDMVDCVTEHPSRWFTGPYGYVFENPILFRNPIPYKGSLGLFNVSDEVSESC
jgi:hypothetical protein